MGGREGRETLGSESSAEERNKCINNKGDVTSGWRGCPTCWLNPSLHGRTGLFVPHVCVCVCLSESVYSMSVCVCPLSCLREKTHVEFKQRS